MPLSHFDEKRPVVTCSTEWGKWWQTVGEVFIEVDVEEGTLPKQIQIQIKPNFISCKVKDKEIFQGKLRRTVMAEESTWVLEERKRISILLVKSDPPNTEHIWQSLLVGQFAPNPWEFGEMQKQLDLERFQIENPGFDFSSANLSKCYDKISEQDKITEKSNDDE